MLSPQCGNLTNASEDMLRSELHPVVLEALLTIIDFDVVNDLTPLQLHLWTHRSYYQGASNSTTEPSHLLNQTRRRS